jgi:hypothetical protein
VLPLPAARAADVGVSINISQPGVYGRVDIGRFPQPQVVVQQPVIIGRPVAVRQEPVYLWVPPAHRQNWRRHCGQYQACGVPVYFVQDRWYGEHVRPHARDRDERHGERRDDRREDRRDDRRDNHHDDGPGRGQGQGRGHDK